MQVSSAMQAPRGHRQTRHNLLSANRRKLKLRIDHVLGVHSLHDVLLTYRYVNRRRGYHKQCGASALVHCRMLLALGWWCTHTHTQADKTEGQEVNPRSEPGTTQSLQNDQHAHVSALWGLQGYLRGVPCGVCRDI